MRWKVRIIRVMDNQFNAVDLRCVRLKKKQVTLPDGSTEILEILQHSAIHPKLYFRPRLTSGWDSIDNGIDTTGYVYVLRKKNDSLLIGDDFTDYTAVAYCQLVR